MSQKELKVVRNLNLEWFRILGMLMIVMLHSIDHSSLYESLVPGTPIYYYEMFNYGLVQVCVNCFVLLSGYFLVTSSFKISKFLSLWVIVVFYSFFIKFIMMIIGEVPFSLVSLLSCFFPVITGRYWFVTIYMGMYLLSPFFNITIKALTKRQHGILNILLLLLFSCFISIYPSIKGMNSGGGWGIAWFSVLYFIASYFRLHYKPSTKYLKSLLVFLLGPMLMLIGTVVADKMSLSVVSNIVENWYRYDFILVIISSVALMIFFLNINFCIGPKWSKFILWLSGGTFGVYLIHAHADICTEEKWQMLGMVSNSKYWWFPLFQIFVVIAIFIGCVLIDSLRQTIFKKLRISVFIGSVSLKVERNLNRIYNYLEQLVLEPKN